MFDHSDVWFSIVAFKGLGSGDGNIIRKIPSDEEIYRIIAAEVIMEIRESIP